jgi:hypothetical protein
MSRVQDAFVERRISMRISSVVAGENSDIVGGLVKDGMFVGSNGTSVGIKEQSLVIFESK